MNFSIERYIKEKEEIQTALLEFLDKANEATVEYQNLLEFLEKQKIKENRNELKLLLHLLSKISKNHHRNLYFFQKIEKIILIFKEEIINFFTNSEIFDLFHRDKIILLFLLDQKIISIDQTIIKYIFQKSRKETVKISHFLSTEIKPFIKGERKRRFERQISRIDPIILEDFKEKRLQGENDSKICSLIRDDSVVEFISYCTKNNISLSSQIDPSIYETNSFLLKNKKTSLIEYSAFYGSIQIFNFLRMNNVELSPSLWLYAIHSNNAELIHLLEENKVEPKDLTYKECLKEAIKCHHNDVAIYIRDNLIDEKKIKFKFDKNEKSFAFHYYNFAFLGNPNYSLFYYACKYDYITISFNCTPLHLAAINNNIEIINLLLSNHEIKIGKECFRGCKKLTQIAIPSHVKSIEDSTFEDCSSLLKVEFSSSCSIERIGELSFKNCFSLKQINIPPSVNEIDSSAFEGCSSLIEIIIPESVNKIGSYAFSGCKLLKKAILPSLIKQIGRAVFLYCSSLKELEIPSTIIKIEEYMFKGCSSLKKIKIHDSLIEIGNNSFEDCCSLEDFKIPSSVVSIGSNAFYGCSSFKQVILPSSITEIKSHTFNRCKGLIFVSILKSVVKIGDYAFFYCTGLKEIKMPPSVTSIGKYAFFYCTDLKEIKMPPSVISIDQNAFAHCHNLIKIEISNSEIVIQENAFEYCNPLCQITIPSHVDQSKLGLDKKANFP